MASTQRPRKDNVIFANFGTRKKVGTPVADVQHSGPSTLANRLRDLASQATDRGRLSRGIQYQREGRVHGLAISDGVLSAAVKGTQNSPFGASVVLPYRSEVELAKILTTIVEQGAVGDARAGRFSPQVLDQVLAESPGQLRMNCSCQDRVDCCKHVVALLYEAAALFDAQPDRAVSLRAFLADSLTKGARPKASSEGESQSYQSFWVGEELPPVPTPKAAPALDDSDTTLLSAAMRQISYTAQDQLRAVADIEDMYYFLTRE